jgi:ribonuclease P protein component
MNVTPERLRRRRDFLDVARKGRKWVAPSLILQIRPQMEDSGAAQRQEKRLGGGGVAAANTDRGTLRVGFTVSRKVGGAVVRNRARRRLRAAVAAVMPYHAAPDFDYVVIGRRTTVGRKFAALRGDLETALRRLGVWQPDDTPSDAPNDAPNDAESGANGSTG